MVLTWSSCQKKHLIADDRCDSEEDTRQISFEPLNFYLPCSNIQLKLKQPGTDRPLTSNNAYCSSAGTAHTYGEDIPETSPVFS